MCKIKQPKKEKAPKPQRQPKEKPAKIKNVESLKVIRVIVWLVIGFLLVRGVAQIVRPDKTAVIESSVKRQNAELTSFVNTKTDVGEYAKAFLQDYLTYTQAGNATDYAKKITTYGSSLTVQGARFAGDAAPTFLQVVRCTQYSTNQWDALIRADVDYTKHEKVLVKQEDGSTKEEVTQTSQSKTLYYVVPVYVAQGSMAVEALPMPSAAPPSAKQQQAAPQGMAIDGAEQAKIKTTLTDFFATYYTESQNKINYYLAPDADPAQFYGLGGAIGFERIAELAVYKSGDIYTAIVHVTTEDAIGTQQTAQLHLKLVKTKDKYYILSMLPRTENIV